MRIASTPFGRRAVLGYQGLAAIAASLAIGTAHCYAQSETPPHTVVNLNYVYAASLGFGGYSIGGLSAGVYTLPLSNTWSDIPKDGWSLKLLLPIQLGIYHFSADYLSQHFSLDQQSISAVPGVELQIPVTDNAVVKPFVQAGIAHAFGSGVGNPDSYVYLAGARALTQWKADEYTLSLGNAVVYAGDTTVGPGFAEHYISLQIAGEIRRPLGFKVGDFAPDLGVYVANYFYPAPLRFSRFLKPDLLVHDQGEVGFSVGSAQPFKLLWLSNPRLGAGFVFGGGLNVYRVSFGFPF